MDSKLVGLDALSDITGLPREWLRREADAGRIPCIRAGRRRMFDPPAVLKVLTDRARREGVRDA